MLKRCCKAQFEVVRVFYGFVTCGPVVGFTLGRM